MAGRSICRIGVVGAGAMAQAFVQGVVGSGIIPATAICVANRANDERLARLRAVGVVGTRDKALLCAHSDVVVLAVKPKDVSEALEELRAHVLPRHLILSLVAGIPMKFIEGRLGPGTRVVRAMANTSSSVRESATAIAPGRFAGVEDLQLASELLAALGPVLTVDESSLDAVTALAGSGPAYVYLLTESMLAAGAGVGLAPEVSRKLVLQTIYGAARMLVETDCTPEELRTRVTSPGGTTAAAVGVLEELGFRDSLIRAVARAKERSQELGLAYADGT